MRTRTRIQILLLLMAASAATGQPPGLLNVNPPRQELQASTRAAIEIQFDQAMDTASADARSVRAFGRWSGPAELNFRWEDGGRRLVATAARPFSAGELVTVYVARTLRSTNAETLARGHSWQFWIESRPAPFEFARGASVSTRRPGEGLVRSYGGYGGDLNRDGYSDLAVTNEVADDLRIYYNDGSGNFDGFEILPLLNGGGPSANEGADFDHDGEIDLVVGNAFADAAMVLLGDGSGGFEDFVGHPVRDNVRAVGVLDLDGDACEDIVAACMEESAGDGALALLRGDGDGGFAAAEFLDTPATGERALAVGDANGDGLLDLFVASDPAANLQLLLGDGDGGFQLSSTVGVSGSAWVVAAGDLNGDGHCDAVTAGGFSATMAVVLSRGDGGLFPATILAAGSLTVSVDLGDLDGDGDLDIVGSNLFGRSWTLYRNDGRGNFGGRVDLPATEAGSCAILHDRDNDGIVDLTAVDERADELVFFERVFRRVLPPRDLLAHPNPFFPVMHLQFRLEQPGSYRLEIFDLRGRRVVDFGGRSYPVGLNVVEWDVRDHPAAAGVYHLRLQGAHGSATHSVVLLR